MTIEEINKRLMLWADEKNAKHSSSLTPNARPMLGARIPDLRKLAKEIAKENYRAFLEECPEDYFEQQMLQAFVLGYAKDDIEALLAYADRFIPKINNWAVNDSFCQTFKTARRYRDRVWEWMMAYAAKSEEYPQRVVAVLMLSHFLTDDYIEPVLAVLNRLSCDAYYAKMGVAWCAATAYAKYPRQTYAFLLENQLDDWTFNKSIQKMTESFRVPDEDKKMLRKMKRRPSKSSKDNHFSS